MTTQLVLDTDIGTDVDDVLALATIFGSPELTLGAITTAYGDVSLRAQIAAQVARVAGQEVGSVVPGRSETRSGREVWWPGHEGRLFTGLEGEQIRSDLDAAAVLADSPVVAAIGPLTNVADAVELPGSSIAEVFLMGGEFTDGVPEHNILCDVAAAEAVFSSGRRATVIGLDQTEKLRLDAAVLHRFEAAGELGRLLADEMRQFWEFAGQDHNVPHDPAALVMITSPQLFKFRSGEVSVDTAGSRPGRTRFAPDPSGPHRLVTDLDAPAVVNQIVDRILAACAHGARASLEGERA